MASGDWLLDANGDQILNADGDIALSDGTDTCEPDNGYLRLMSCSTGDIIDVGPATDLIAAVGEIILYSGLCYIVIDGYESPATTLLGSVTKKSSCDHSDCTSGLGGCSCGSGASSYTTDIDFIQYMASTCGDTTMIVSSQGPLVKCVGKCDWAFDDPTNAACFEVSEGFNYSIYLFGCGRFSGESGWVLRAKAIGGNIRWTGRKAGGTTPAGVYTRFFTSGACASSPLSVQVF